MFSRKTNPKLHFFSITEISLLCFICCVCFSAKPVVKKVCENRDLFFVEAWSDQLNDDYYN